MFPFGLFMFVLFLSPTQALQCYKGWIDHVVPDRATIPDTYRLRQMRSIMEKPITLETCRITKSIRKHVCTIQNVTFQYPVDEVNYILYNGKYMSCSGLHEVFFPLPQCDKGVYAEFRPGKVRGSGKCKCYTQDDHEDIINALKLARETFLKSKNDFQRTLVSGEKCHCRDDLCNIPDDFSFTTTGITTSRLTTASSTVVVRAASSTEHRNVDLYSGGNHEEITSLDLAVYINTADSKEGRFMWTCVVAMLILCFV